MPRHCSVVLAVSLAFLAACGQNRQVSSTSTAAPTTTPDKQESPARAVTAPLPADQRHVQPVDAAGLDERAQAQVASVREATTNGTHPERVSPLIPPAAFDQQAWARDPESYLRVSEPGRVFQTATPGPDVPVLVPSGPVMARIRALGTTALVVRAPAGAPVSWTSGDLGAFDNHLSSITVRADDQGLARVTFTAISGTAASAHILVGSPLASGQVRFTVDVIGGPETSAPPASPQQHSH